MFDNLMMSSPPPADGVSIKNAYTTAIPCYFNYGLGNWAQLDSTRFVLGFTSIDGSNHWPSVVIVEVNPDGSLTIGTPYQTSHWSVSSITRVAVLDSSTILLSYVGSYPTYITLSVSGLSITGEGTQYISTNYWPYGAHVAGVDSTHVLAAANLGPTCAGSILTNTGGTLTEGTPYTFQPENSTPGGYEMVVDACLLTSTTALTMYTRSTETYGQILTITGTSLGGGVETMLTTYAASRPFAWSPLGGVDKFLIKHADQLAYFTISGTTVTKEGGTTLTALTSGYASLMGLTDTKAILCANAGSSGEIMAGRITRVGNSVSLGTNILTVDSVGSISGLTGIGLSSTLGLIAYSPYSDYYLRFAVLEAL